MKTSISDFYDFKNSISDDELVFIFGTGISSALSGKKYGWKKWIVDGINFFEDRDIASTLSDSLENDSSVENMIEVVGRVIEQAKTEGFYDRWMHSSFETAQITNRQLADTLRTLARIGDVFATTNYDLLLESATGLMALSYTKPDEAFAMLDARKSEAVIHIHGIYDSVHGVDDIVANNDQYRNVLNDKGAQFIQNLLGTRTLVFIGCGSTTDDININQFIRFAWDHLKLNKQYYFLYNLSSAVPKVPDNIRLIPYGDNYDDLPDFLEEMAQFRLRKKLLDSSLIGRTAYDTYPTTGDELLRYHYSQRAIPLCGRTEELKKLIEFLNHDTCFLWWVITGSAGSGKSRLAFELLYSLPTTWFGFFLKDDVSKEDIDNYIPASDNVIVIDYVAGRERSIARTIQGLKSKFSKYKLRVLLLERDNNRATGSWYSKLLQGFSREDRQIIKDSLHGEFLDLNSFGTEEAEQLINAVLLFHDKNNPNAKEILKGYKAKLNPLYLQMHTEAWLSEEPDMPPKYDSVTTLLESLLKREQERWLSVFEKRQDICNAFIRLLVRANISGYIQIDSIPDYYQSDWRTIKDYISTQTFSGTQRDELRDSLINIVCQNVETKHAIISPEYPDIIKEYMFCYYTDRDELPALMEEVWQNIPRAFTVFIHKCLMDFDDQPFFKEALNVYNDTVPNHQTLLGRLNLLESRPIQPGEDPLVYLDIIENEHKFWFGLTIPEGRETEIAIFKVIGLSNVAKQIGAWSMFNVSEMLSCIDEMLAVPGGQEIDVLKKTLLQEFITNLNRHSFFREANLLREKLNSLMHIENGDELDALLLMQGYNERMINAGIEGKWNKAREILHEMENNCRVDYLHSAQTLAHSCASLEQLSLQLGHYNIFGDGLSILKSLENRFPNDQIIRARRIENEAAILTKQFFKRHFPKDQIRNRLKPLEMEIADFQFQEINSEDVQAINDAFCDAWSAVMALKLNLASDIELKEIEKEAKRILSGHADLAGVAYVRICATIELYKKHLHKKIPHEIVEELYKHVIDNPESAVVREAFFNMLKQSEDAGRSSDYFTPEIIKGALQDARYNSLMGSGVDEIDLYESLIEAAVVSEQEVDRGVYKIGRNDPCPCGSGKKFKKCCFGKGIYD